MKFDEMQTSALNVHNPPTAAIIGAIQNGSDGRWSQQVNATL